MTLTEIIDSILEGDGSHNGISCDMVYDAIADDKEVVHGLLKHILSGEDKEAFYLALRECQDKCERLLVSKKESELC